MKEGQETIGKRISLARNTIGNSIDDFSAATGIPVSTLKKYESNNRTPGGEAIQSIAKTGVNAHWLVTGDGPVMIRDSSQSEKNDYYQKLIREIKKLQTEVEKNQKEKNTNELTEEELQWLFWLSRLDEQEKVIVGAMLQAMSDSKDMEEPGAA